MAISKGKKAQGQPTYPAEDVYTLSDLDQVRVLADPLRLRILEALCQERTTKQVAESIDEKPTKLYHHVEALERVGLIHMTRTRQNRGTLEKYFLAVAKTFRADSRLFAGDAAGGPASEALQAVAATAFDNTAAELRELIARGDSDLEAEVAFSYVEIRTSDKKMKRIQAKIEKLLAEIVQVDAGTENDTEKDADMVRHRLTLAFFPLRGTPRARKRK